MIACRFFALRTAIVVLTSIVATGIAQAQVFYWDGGDGSSTDIQEASNWSTDVAPSIAANPATDELHFGPASFTVVDHSVQLYIDQIIFDAGAPAYTFNENAIDVGQDFAFYGGPNMLLVNNSSTPQSIGAAFNLAGVRVRTPSAGFEFHPGASGSGVYANVRVRFELTHDVVMNNQQNGSGARNVYGANGPSTLPTDSTGTLHLNVASGTGSSSSTNFTGQMVIWSGAVRVGNSDALGRSTGNSNYTYIHGTFANIGLANPDAQVDVNGFDHGFGRLELYNNITLAERLRIDGRQGDVADFDHVVNVSDSNTLSPGALTLGGAGHWNFRSDAGTLSLINDMQCGDPGKEGDSINSNSVWTLRGAGNIDYSGNLLADLFAETATALRKQGAGTLTLYGTANAWEGGTLIEGGTIVVGSGAVLSTAGPAIHVASGATLDLSESGGLTLGASNSLSGSGLVKGNVSASDATSIISPGGTGGLDASDAIVVTAGAGQLTLDHDLDMTTNGTVAWNLAALSTSNPGVDFDRLVVNGNAAVGGAVLSLDFSLLGVDGPSGSNAFWDAGHSWTVLDAASNTGDSNFLSVANGVFPGGSFSTSVSSGDIVLKFVPSAGLPGDYNNDSVVDSADYVVWRKNEGTSNVLPNDNGIGGVIGSAHYDLWRSHFGNSSGSGFGALSGGNELASGAVPEPNGLLSLLTAFLATFHLHRNYRRGHTT
ncbi:MAG: autotransporter-associated beta strand repeat-containing protein [Pirellulales bacterium]|nr:autotransporter-associated beta strand repeat-containing protein [Pirellulales bacterium]